MIIQGYFKQNTINLLRGFSNQLFKELICISHSLNFTERPMVFKMKFKADTFFVNLDDARCTDKIETAMVG